MPEHYKILDRVQTKNGYCAVTCKYSEQEIKQRLKNNAASLGGNGVVIIQSDAVQITANVILFK